MILRKHPDRRIKHDKKPNKAIRPSLPKPQMLRTFANLVNASPLPKITGNQLGFINAIVRGMSPVDAYQHAFPNQARAPIYTLAVRAQKILSSPAVKLWLDYQSKSLVQGSMRTHAEFIANMERLKIAAIETDQLETARKCEEAIGRVSGLYVDRSVIDVTHHVDASAVESELVRRSPDLAARLATFRSMLEGGKSDLAILEGVAERLDETQHAVSEGHKRSRKRDQDG